MGKRDVLGSWGGGRVCLKCVLHNGKHCARSPETVTLDPALPRAFCVILANFLLCVLFSSVGF